MAIITTDKVVLIVVVTAIVIILAYVFRFGALFRQKQARADSAGSQQDPTDSN
jgi:hypothetical protein